MMGRNHLVVGTALGAALVVWTKALADPDHGATAFLQEGIEAAGEAPVMALLAETVPWSVRLSEPFSWLVSWAVPLVDGSMWLLPWSVAALCLFWLGSLLPDVDSAKSILGRHFPKGTFGPHRGFTHTDWLLVALLLVSLPGPMRILFWLFLGTALHDWLDGLGRAGRARFYPLGSGTKVVELSGGERCVVVTSHRGLYRSGRRSETIVAAVLLVLSGLAVAGAVLLA